ncbi:hypothetical protein Hdeb2414_s0017g00504001 [Helianthus debilis subsp. tardiflorus]
MFADVAARVPVTLDGVAVYTRWQSTPEEQFRRLRNPGADHIRLKSTELVDG